VFLFLINYLLTYFALSLTVEDKRLLVSPSRFRYHYIVMQMFLNGLVIFRSEVDGSNFYWLHRLCGVGNVILQGHMSSH